MKSLTILQIIVALLLIVVTILQNRGEGALSFGGGGESFRSKRGLEKFLFYATIVLGIIFASLSIISLLLR